LAEGIVPAWVVGDLLAAAASATIGGELPAYSLSIWHGFNLPLQMRVVALAGGVLVCAWRASLFAMRQRWARPHATAMFGQVVQRLVRAAQLFVQWIDGGSLQRYVAWLLLPVALVMLAAIGTDPDWIGELPLTPADSIAVLGVAMAVVAAFATVILRRQRLLA